MPSPLSPPPVKRRLPDALPPYLSNGVLGIRFPGVPYLSGTTMVSGFAGLHPNDGVEGFARAPFVLAADVQVARRLGFRGSRMDSGARAALRL